jgi:hypothetical protein
MRKPSVIKKPATVSLMKVKFMQRIVKYDTDVYLQLSKISFEIQVATSGYLTPGFFYRLRLG